MEKLEQLHTKFDIIFVGGGPSTLSFFSYLFKENLIENFMKNFNFLIIEKSEFFGSGCLINYGIKSNTSGEGFLRLLCYPEKKENKSNLSPPKKKSSLNTEIKSKKIIQPLPIFKELFDSYISQTLYQYGSKSAPLGLIGHYFNCLGNFIVEYLAREYKKNIIMLKTEVNSIKMTNTQDYIVTIKRDEKFLVLNSKIVVLATGGRPYINNKLQTEINKLIAYPNSFFTSDSVLRESGYLKLINDLNKRTEKNVIIIGSGHSAFSVAHILLNGPSVCSIDSHNYKLNHKCLNCEKCNYNCFGNISEPKDIFTKKIGISAKLDQKLIEKNCNGFCYGKIFPSKNFKSQLICKDSERLNISILYRDRIKVYYHSEEEAKKDNYFNYDPGTAKNKSGNIYPFIGLRGDAKELYNKIVKGKEKRVKLVQTENFEKQKTFISTQDAILIWACGYETNFLKFYDCNNRLLELNKEPGYPFEVNKDLNIIDKQKTPIRSLFGIGQGYSTFSIEIINGKKSRADSVNLYNTCVSKKLFKSIFSYFNRDLNENKLSTQIQKEKAQIKVDEKNHPNKYLKNDINNPEIIHVNSNQNLINFNKGLNEESNDFNKKKTIESVKKYEYLISPDSTKKINKFNSPVFHNSSLKIIQNIEPFKSSLNQQRNETIIQRNQFILDNFYRHQMNLKSIIYSNQFPKETILKSKLKNKGYDYIDSIKNDHSKDIILKK